MYGSERFLYAARYLVLRHALLLKAVSDVLRYCHVREERIALKYHTDISLVYRYLAY